MSPVLIPEVSEDGFGLRARVQGKRLLVRVSGNGDMDAIAPLKQHLESVHAAALKEKLTEVVYDFEELYFLNSSCLKAFVTWIHTVRSEGRPYAICFLANDNQHWQRRSLDALRRLAPDVVSVAACAKE